ncbi:uncharacterized protein B0H64DRAFT_374423 [Chaetomium fimeti]|uniref:Ankyrin repeat domain-containing protein n=1 Tax=Chaetomium fimeti TaxID=1854472 RepID=A0AAE0HGV9_9PEZI|nr:hypothetical protein B0H64DRAFT_374423 [Chaetomium fimeti]
MDGAEAPMAHGLSDLHIAVISGQADRVLKILTQRNKNALVNSGDADGATPLMTAVLTGRLTIAHLLLRNGGSPRVRDRRGYQASDYSKASFFKTKFDIYKRLGLPEPADGSA